MVVSVENRKGVAVVKIDNPPVNATSHAVRAALWNAVETTDSDPMVNAVVLICSGRGFIAGADVREFGNPPQSPILPDLLAKIERATKPWVAAIHGPALGGGLETAMVCSSRIATPEAKLGLPEVNLGLIPGAGGTVRLPRLIPADKALDMIATGKLVTATKALKLGLIDDIVQKDLLKAAIAKARELAETSGPSPLVSRSVAPFDRATFEKTAEKITNKYGPRNAPIAAIQALRNAIDLSFSDALEAERQAFSALKADPQSAALRHVFFAERATTKLDRLNGVHPRSLTSIGIIGGGTMGAGISAAALLAGYSVVMVERDAEAAAVGAARVTKILDGSLKRGILSLAALNQTINRFDAVDSYAALSDVDMVIEAVFEDLDVKKDVFAQLALHTSDETILATNTSYLDINLLANSVPQPERVIGLHFFSPAHIMKLLEVVVPNAASDEVLSSGIAFAKSLRKIPVISGVCDGFIANRIMSAYRREAEYMLEDGAMPWQIDAAMRDYGLPMGLFEMQDLAGLDISWAMRKRQAATRDPDMRYVHIGDKLCEAGHFGRKTGRGYYIYDDTKTPQPNPDAEALILAESTRKGIQRQPMTADIIMERILKSMQDEGTKILHEGVAQSADDIDVVMVNAYGFPRGKGGPMWQKKLSDNR